MMEMLCRLEPSSLPVMCGKGVVLVLVVPLAACLLWSLRFHLLIFGYRVAVETTAALCLPLLWLPAKPVFVVGDNMRWCFSVCSFALAA